MYPEDECIKLATAKTKIETIYTIIERHGSITNALGDIEGQPAILMLLVAISEQFSKLAKKESKLLEHFDSEDIKGLIAVRNYIAHDYDGVNLTIIEDDLRENMPRILALIKRLLPDVHSLSV
ncbi:MAG: DUF86 domain-containing protein [Campylobacterales bacterium]|nr:DUF86 domain-containing protein [Campylobacterales bacterium]